VRTLTGSRAAHEKHLNDCHAAGGTGHTIVTARQWIDTMVVVSRKQCMYNMCVASLTHSSQMCSLNIVSLSPLTLFFLFLQGVVQRKPTDYGRGHHPGLLPGGAQVSQTFRVLLLWCCCAVTVFLVCFRVHCCDCATNIGHGHHPDLLPGGAQVC
jgi:hypothetical protein